MNRWRFRPPFVAAAFATRELGLLRSLGSMLASGSGLASVPALPKRRIGNRSTTPSAARRSAESAARYWAAVEAANWATIPAERGGGQASYAAPPLCLSARRCSFPVRLEHFPARSAHRTVSTNHSTAPKNRSTVRRNGRTARKNRSAAPRVGSLEIRAHLIQHPVLWARVRTIS